MFFPLSFWIRVGDLACAPSRKRRLHKPLPTLSQAEAEEIVGPELAQPFVAVQERVDAYQAAAELVASLDKRIRPADELVAATNELFRNPPKEKVWAALEQLSHCAGERSKIPDLLQASEWQFPVTPGDEMEFAELTGFKRLDLLLQMQAAVSWLSGDVNAAVAHLETADALARRIQNCEGLFIHELVGMSCRSRLYRLIRSGLRVQTGSDSFYAKLDPFCAPRENLPDRLSRLFDREFRFAILPNICLRGTPAPPVKERDLSNRFLLASHAQQILVEWTFRNHPRPVDRRKSLKLAKDGYQTVRSESQNGWACVEAFMRLSKEFGKGIPKEHKSTSFDPMFGVQAATVLKASASFKRMENAYGLISLSSLFEVGGNLVTASYKCEAEMAATRICIAAARYSKGPVDSLYALLNAGFLDEIPTDPTSGLPFRLDPESQSIWLPGPQNMTFAQADANRKNGAWIWNFPASRA